MKQSTTSTSIALRVMSAPNEFAAAFGREPDRFVRAGEPRVVMGRTYASYPHDISMIIVEGTPTTLERELAVLVGQALEARRSGFPAEMNIFLGVFCEDIVGFRLSPEVMQAASEAGLEIDMD